MDPNEARVARLEKIAFGSTYPEHEVEDRVDHLEKEIFTDKSTGDLQERLNRLERKLCGGTSGSFGSPMKQSGQYGSYAGGASSVAVAPSVPQLALKSPDDPPSSQGSVPSDSSSGSSDDDEGSASQSSGDDSTTAQDDAGSMDGESSDDDAASASDTADGVSTQKGKGPAASDLKAMATGTSSPTEASTKGRTKSVAPRIPYDKGAGDYANRISRFVNNSTARWTTFPVRVRLPEGENNDWKKSMEVGLEKWGRYIPLKTATVSETADIEVSFVNHLTPRVLGVTRLTVTGGRMKVFVFMLRPNYYPAIPEKVLAHAFMHELGHAIGIFGHSDKPSDAMFTFEIASNGKLTQEKLGTLSTRDVNTLKVIYDAKPLPEDFNMSAPQEWGYTHESS